MKRLLQYAAVGLVFVYGFAAGHYRLFPYQIIDDIHTRIVRMVKPPQKKVRKPVAVKPKVLRDGQWRTPYYRLRLSVFQQSKTPFDYIMLGDSITDIAQWHELMPGVSIANRGINGDTTYGLLDRLEPVLATNPKRVFIMIGINDLKWGLDLEASVANYKKILQRIKESKVPVTVFGVIYPGLGYQQKYKRRFRGDLSARVSLFNQELALYCMELGVEFRDLNPMLSVGGLLKDEFTYDGLHLNGNAYAIWVEELQKALQLPHGMSG